MPTVLLLTPPGRGAIATVLVEGPGALAAVAVHFRPASGRPLEECAENRPIFGHFGPAPGEEVVVCRRSAESVEIHGHGGHAAVARLVELLTQSGCQPGDWHAWVRQQTEDRFAAEARIALADARTERTARILLDQFHGALRRALEEIQRLLDAGQRDSARQAVEALLARATLGRHLVEPWRVVLAGPPNAGKSSLINALVGYERALVHAVPGTTRDVVTATTAIDGWPVELSDTAGLRETVQPVERAGIALAHETVAAADLVILVFDGHQPWSAEDAALLSSQPEALVIHNKADLPPDASPTRPAGLWTSAVQGTGVPELLQAIAARLVPDPPPPGAAVPFTAAQCDAVRAIVGQAPRA